jgi:hypothetical protein
MSAQPAPNRDSEARASTTSGLGVEVGASFFEGLAALLQEQARLAVEEDRRQRPETQPERQVWYSREQASAYTGLSVETIRAAARAGDLREHRRSAERPTYHVSDLDTYMRGGAA